MKREKEYQGPVEEYNFENLGKGEAISSSLQYKSVGIKYQVKKRGLKFWGIKSRFKKNCGGEEYQVVGKLYTSLGSGDLD